MLTECDGKISYEKIYTKRVRGGPIFRWFDDLREDFRILEIKYWRSTEMDREAWRLLVQEVKDHKGL
jgi:hypothetical protein